MYSIYMQSYLLLTGYCFVARRHSAIFLSSTSTSCCFSSALLRRALAFVTNDNSPLFSHFSYNSFEVERREETSVFNRLRLPSNSCIASVSFLFLFRSLPPVLPFVDQVIGILSSGTSSCQHHVASNLSISYTINMDDVILYYSPCCQFVLIGFQRPVPCWPKIPFLRRPIHVIRATLAHKLPIP